MTKWEYLCIMEVATFETAGKFIPMLNIYGGKGWELIHFEYRNSDCMLIFKRPVWDANG